MASTAGHNTRVRFKIGTTAFTDEATTNLGSNRYTITDLAKALFDPEVAVVVKDGGTPIATTGYTVNHLAGQVTLNSAPAGAVTITGSALQLADAVDARQMSWVYTTNQLDVTVFGDDAVGRLPGLKDVSGTVSRLADSLQDFDTGGGTLRVYDVLTSGDYTVVETQPDRNSSAHVARAFALFESDQVESQVDDLVTAVLNFQGTLPGSAIYSGWIGTLGT